MTTIAKQQPDQCLGHGFLPGSIPVGLYLKKVRAGIVSAIPAAQARKKEVWLRNPVGARDVFHVAKPGTLPRICTQSSAGSFVRLQSDG